MGAGQLSRRIARQSTAAWSIGVLALALLAIGVFWRSADEGIDSELRAHALAAYGLSFWDESGRFHSEYLELETELFAGPVQLTVADPSGTVFGPEHPRGAELVDRVLESEDEVWLQAKGRRSLALPSYTDDDRVVAAVIASRDIGPVRGETFGFAAAVLAGSAGLILLGLALSRWLADRILQALEAELSERERILAGAAHELRTPLASLMALVDSSPPGAEAQTLGQVRETVDSTSGMVDRLLTWSRLAHDEPQLEPVRLDLLVELCLEEDEALEASASVVQADPRLLEVALRNLLKNARVHGGGVRLVRVSAGRVEVLDHGPGVPSEQLRAPFTKGAKSPGTGLGLALVERIADKHGGRLELRPVVALVFPEHETGSLR